MNNEPRKSMTNHPTRRHAFQSLAAGSLLMPGLMSQLLGEDNETNPLDPKQPHFPAKA